MYTYTITFAEYKKNRRLINRLNSKFGWFFCVLQCFAICFLIAFLLKDQVVSAIRLGGFFVAGSTVVIALIYALCYRAKQKPVRRFRQLHPDKSATMSLSIKGDFIYLSDEATDEVEKVASKDILYMSETSKGILVCYRERKKKAGMVLPMTQEVLDLIDIPEEE